MRCRSAPIRPLLCRCRVTGLSEPSCLFDLSEHRLDHLLSEPVERAGDSECRRREKLAQDQGHQAALTRRQRLQERRGSGWGSRGRDSPCRRGCGGPRRRCFSRRRRRRLSACDRRREAVQRLGVQDELTTLGLDDEDSDRHLAAELVGCPGLALADALDLRACSE